jgi:hypothetical protein
MVYCDTLRRSFHPSAVRCARGCQGSMKCAALMYGRMTDKDSKQRSLCRATAAVEYYDDSQGVISISFYMPHGPLGWHVPYVNRWSVLGYPWHSRVGSVVVQVNHCPSLHRPPTSSFILPTHPSPRQRARDARLPCLYPSRFL